jgi:hypothetical protein
MTDRVALAVGLALLVLGAAMALPLAAATPANVVVNNHAPSVTSVDLPASVAPTSGSTTSVTVNSTIRDGNGYNDINSVTVTVYKPDNSTVHVAASAATQASGNGKDASYTYSFTMDYSDDPGTYYVKVAGADRGAATAVGWSSFTLQSLAAMSLDVGSISFGDGSEIAPGSDTDGAPATVTVTNQGNTQMDLQFSGTALSNATLGTSIGAGNVWYSRASDMSGATAFSGSAQTDTGFNLAKGAGQTKSAYISVHVPSGTRAGTYTGTLTLAAVAG